MVSRSLTRSTRRIIQYAAYRIWPNVFRESLQSSPQSSRPGQSDQCTNLEYPVGIYYDFNRKNWFFKECHKKILTSHETELVWMLENGRKGKRQKCQCNFMASWTVFERLQPIHERYRANHLWVIFLIIYYKIYIIILLKITF